MWKSIDYNDTYFELLIDLFRDNYGNIDLTDRSFIQHQYFNNPNGNAEILLAIDNGSVVGQYSVCPMRVKVFDKEAVCILSLNTLTRESHRGQGIFTKLAEDTYDHVKDTAIFCYGMPNQNSYKGFITKLDFKAIGTLPLFLKPLKPSKIIDEYFGSTFLSCLARPFDIIYTHKNSIDNKEDYKINRITEENIALMDNLWDKIKSKYPIMFVRDSKFIRWRYLEMPLRNYYLYMVLYKNEPVAFAAGRIMKVTKITCGMLADFIIAPSAEEAGNLLIEFMQKEFTDKGASLMGSLMQKSTQEGKLLKKSKFFICPKSFEPQPFPLILRIFDEKLKNTEIRDFNKWFFTMGDYDVV